MTASTRAFLFAALFTLPIAALLHLLALLGLRGAWPAMVHLTLFGWITAMISTVSYHTMPVFAARDFPFQRMIWAHWAALAAGVALAALGIPAPWPAGQAAGLLLEIAAALLFLANVASLFLYGPRRPHRPPMPVAQQPHIDRVGSMATRLAALCLPTALLLLLAAQLGWLGGGWALAGEHLATLGWIMLMIVGVAYHVLPRFSGIGTRGPRWARAQLACHVGALALMVPALGFGWSALFAFGGLLMLLAIGLFAWTVWPALRVVDMRAALIQVSVKGERPR